ncbi:uncharacterized protein PV06_02633 [Exophiala oligosperma]|uniref:Xylanolytic transcriptional activator regulatory domain-containing protein n=1 Tax=Exophiala oligosperma TaxID=215243 RepID=A0A0D2EGH9_9EURO|nr:uncharacterized protein PV06_02633 [Exophiala oligosperma]KIW47019.1 hypothetical protein PV06_02633 [Exophiala oligosperma]
MPLKKCGLCEAAGEECVGYDSVAKRNVPRRSGSRYAFSHRTNTDRDTENSYVQSLEERVAYLEMKLQEHGLGHELEPTPRPTISPAPVSFQANVGTASPNELSNHFSLTIDEGSTDNADNRTIRPILSLTQRGATYEAAFSQILLSELIRAKTSQHIFAKPRTEREDNGNSSVSGMVEDFDASPVSLPTRQGVRSLVKAYFHFANMSMPLLHEPTFNHKLELLYKMSPVIDLAGTHNSTEAKRAVFFVFGVLSVALLTLQKQDPSRIPTSLADRYHRMSLKALLKAGLPSDLEGVQALLLIAQYFYHHPTVWAVWKTVGAALRLAVELGLHRDMTPEPMDFLTVDARRRAFWVAYAMDRNISIALGLPSCLADGAITTKFPSIENDEFITADGVIPSDAFHPRPKRVNYHVLRYRQIQSEMRTTLYERAPVACGPVDLDRWQQDMRSRIQAWYDETPRKHNLTDGERKNVENFELTYYRALLYLYHPSANIPTPKEASLMSLAEAASKMIQLYRRFFTEHRLTIYWQAVENLFSAGTALLYSYVNSKQVRDHITMHELETLVHTCSSVLWGMVEHFPDFKGKRDAFDIVAFKALADLNKSSFAEPSLRRDSSGQALIEYAGGPDTSGFYEPAYLHQRPGQMLDGISAYAHQPGMGSTTLIPQDWTQQDQLQIQQNSTGVGVETYEGSTAFSFADFDELSFDWEAFEDSNDLTAPSWP